MAISAGVSGKGSGTGVTSQASNPITTAVSGSAFVGCIIFDAVRTFSTATDSKSNVYTQIPAGEIAFNAGGGKARMYYCENGVGGASHTFTGSVTGGTSDIDVFFQEIPGGALSGILDQNAGRNDTATPFTLAAGSTTTQAAELLLSFLAGNSGSNPATHAESGIGSMTIQQEETNGAGFWPGAMATKVVAATASYNPSWTQSGGTNAAVFLATFKEAAAADTLMGQICT